MTFDNQVKTSREIVQEFGTGKQVVLLFAQMQSGKTGTFLDAAQRLLSSRQIRSTMFMCGSSAVDLNEQLKTSVKEKGLFADNVFKLHDMRRRVDAPEKDTLIVWDEAHYGAKAGNIIPEWFRRHGLDTIEKLREKRVKVLLVSATPFSLSFVPETVVKMTPPSEYRGIGYYTQRAKENNNNNFDEVLIDEHSPNKYGIVRVSNALNEEMIVRSVLNVNSIRGYNWQICTYYPKEGKLLNVSDIVKLLSTRPRSPTLVLVKGRCRMGNVLPKQHLKFVYESTDSPNTTSILQSLLGRICGYHTENISAYLPIQMVMEGKTIPRSMREDSDFEEKTELDVYLWAFQQKELPKRVRKSDMYIL